MKYFWNIIVGTSIILAGCSGGQTKNRTGVLVSNEWLREQLITPSSLIILHVGTMEVFDSVHIQGSYFLDPYDFTVTAGDLRNELPGVSVLGELLRSLGISSDSRILLYYENAEMISRTARVFMTLDYAGLGDQTFVLNGGLQGWTDEDGAVTEGRSGQRPMDGNATDVAVGEIELGDTREVIIRAKELNLLRWSPDYVVVDSRSQDEYYGEFDSTGLNATGGHIEGAHFMDYKTTLSDTIPYRFMEDAVLLKEFKKAQMNRSTTAVYYCGSGVRASVNYMVARHLGFPALVYDGSYQEWEELDLPITSPALDPSEND